MEPKNLKLIAKTKEDLRVVSAHLQDSIASVSDIANLKKNKIFVLSRSHRMPYSDQILKIAHYVSTYS